MHRLAPFILLTVLVGCSTAPPRPESVARGDYDTTRAYLAELVRYEMSRSSVAGLSIALVNGQRVVWAEHMGHRFNLLPGSDDLLHLDYALLGLIHIDLGSLGGLGLARRSVEGGAPLRWTTVDGEE